MTNKVTCPVCHKKITSEVFDFQWSCKDPETGIDHYMKEIVRDRELETIYFDGVIICYEPNATRIYGDGIRKSFKEKLPYLTSKEALQNFLML